MDAETQEIRQARQRASVKWLLSKAFNNRVPDNLKEPFYRDHENQERLKPQIIVEMGNATLYCQTLSNLYSDPNYQSLNHWSILQTLARKGVPVVESPDMPLTETVLIQTNPLRINAHISVIESLMILYAKEISSGDRIPNAIRRISGSNYQPTAVAAATTAAGTGTTSSAPTPTVYEQSLLAWISHACASLNKRIAKDIEAGITDEQGVRLQTPDIPPVRDIQDLCDGICLALLIAYYCPKVVPWTTVRINYLPAVEDSIHNVLLVSSFSQKHLPYSVFHMTPEDITYMRGSMKLNMIVLLADLFNLFEIHPAKCVCYPGMDAQDVIAKRTVGANEHGICHRRGLTTQPVTPIPDLRSEIDLPPSGSPTNRQRPPFQVLRSTSSNIVVHNSTRPLDYHQQPAAEANSNHNEAFVVHKSRGITTLSSMHTQHHHHHQQQQQHYQQQQQMQHQQVQEPLVPARLRQAKEKTNTETKADERGDFVPAGRPSNWEQNRRPSYAGRRSRRNSSSEDSQLTIENFGGSQDQLNMVGRYERDRERERERDRERKLSTASIEPAVAVRSSIADARGTLQLGYDTDSGSEKQDRETEKYLIRRQGSVDNVALMSANNMGNASGSPVTGGLMAGQPQLQQQQPQQQQKQQHSIDKDYGGGLGYGDDARSDYDATLTRKSSQSGIHPKAAAIQQWQNNQGGGSTCDPYEDNMRTMENASKLSTIRMKLEEKQRRIEQDKRKIELAMMRHQDKLKMLQNYQQQQQIQQQNDTSPGALSAVSGGGGSGCGGSEHMSDDAMDIRSGPSSLGSNRQSTLPYDQQQDDIESCADMMKWETMSNESKRTPDIDPVDLDKYQQSIAIMNMNLQDIQQDIQRLATQQSQIQAQHLQAQQLIQAQQIANMLNQQQQSYGSQQHLADNYQQRAMHQQSFGSTPHLPQSFNSPMNNAYNSRPPSRDPYQQQPQMPPLPMQYVNEHGQYMSPQQQQAPPPPHYMQPQSIYSDSPYNNHSGYVGGGGGGGGQQYTPQSHHPQHSHPHQAPYMTRNSVYDDYAPQSHLPHHGGEPPQPQNQFYLHEMSPQPAQQPQPTQRRTWSHSAYEQQQQLQQQQQHQQQQQQHQQQQQQQQPMVDVNAWQSAKKASLGGGGGGDGGPNFNWSKQHGSVAVGGASSQQQNQQQQQGFVLHQNGGAGEFQHLFQVHSSPQHAPRNAGGSVGVQRQQSMTNLRDNRSPMGKTSTGAAQQSSHSSQPPQLLTQPMPGDDMMAPQSICFIGDEEDVDEIERNIIESMQAARLGDYPGQQQQDLRQLHQQQQLLHGERGSSSEDYDSNEMLSNKLNITSGNLTYRIPSPSRPSLHANSFQDPRDGKTPEKGFYISFDDEQPKRPKPPLRAKRSSPKKEPSLDDVDHQFVVGAGVGVGSLTKRESLSQLHNNSAGISDNFNGSASDAKNLHHHQQHYKNNNNNLHSNNNRNNSNNANNNNNNSSNINGTIAHNKATYNKYTDASPTQMRQMAAAGVESGAGNNHDHRRHLEDLTNQQQQQLLHPQSPTNQFSSAASRQQSNHQHNDEAKNKAIIIGNDVATLDPDSVDEMERRKEKIMLLSLQRRQQQEEVKARKEIEASQKREREREKEEERARKKEEQMARRAAILEQHRLKKAIEEAEREGKTLDRSEFNLTKTPSQSNATAPRMRPQRVTRPRPKTIHVDDGSVDISEASSISSRGKKGSSTNLTGYGQLSSNSMRRDFYRGSQDSLTVKAESPDEYPSTSSTPIGRRGSYKTSREPTVERGRTLSRISVAKGSSLNFRGRKSNSLMNLCDTDSGLGRATPPRRAPSPGLAAPSGRHMPSPSGPGSLPPGLISKRRAFDDGSSDISSNQNSMMEYSGPKLYKQPAAKSNRGIILNAVEYCVFPGAVNRDAKQKVLEKIARSEAKHFLVLFRDAGCQFRALYSYAPETDQVCKLYGTGPSQVDEVMFDKFFKYNSGGKCFSQVHTKHLTVTIDAFTIHNSLWQGKKVQLPSKKDMALVI